MGQGLMAWGRSDGVTAMERWYVAYTHANAEQKALFHLRRQGFHVYLPRYLRRCSHARRVELKPVPLFPRYLFIAMDVAAARWRAIHSTVGVTHLVANGTMPVPVPEAVVDGIRAREDATGLVRMDIGPSLARGDRVTIASGPFRELDGLFECSRDEDRVTILLDLLGRQIRVHVPTDAVRASA
ncbi:MAG: transcriptional activator RfaH [Alphaproteobacteria bacterium]